MMSSRASLDRSNGSSGCTRSLPVLPAHPSIKQVKERLQSATVSGVSEIRSKLEDTCNSFHRKEAIIMNQILRVQRETQTLREEILTEQVTCAILRRELSLQVLLCPNLPTQFKEPRPNTHEEFAMYVEPWTKHVEEVFAQGDPAMADYIWKWCAAPLQTPGYRTNTALIVRGNQGLGKSMVGFASLSPFQCDAIVITLLYLLCFTWVCSFSAACSPRCMAMRS